MRAHKYRVFNKETGEFITDWDTGEFSDVTIGHNYFEVFQNELKIRRGVKAGPEGINAIHARARPAQGLGQETSLKRRL